MAGTVKLQTWQEKVAADDAITYEERQAKKKAETRQLEVEYLAATIYERMIAGYLPGQSDHGIRENAEAAFNRAEVFYAVRDERQKEGE